MGVLKMTAAVALLVVLLLVVSKPKIAPAISPLLFKPVERFPSRVPACAGVKSLGPPILTVSVALLATLMFAGIQLAVFPP